MVKCPNCKSTAQIDYGKPYLSDNKNVITLPCECGCGCMFDYEYNVDDNYFTFIHHLERKG